MASNALHRQPPALQHEPSQASRRVTRPRRCRGCTQPQTVGVAAFKAADESISISVDGYNLLQVCHVAMRSEGLQLTAHQSAIPETVQYAVSRLTELPAGKRALRSTTTWSTAPHK